MDNTSIVVAGEKFDINCRVVLWSEDNGLSFYKYNAKYLKRNMDLDQLKNEIKIHTTHHSVTYTAKSTYNGLLGRGLSVNFIIDDNNVDGTATIYQCLDCKDAGYSHKPLNQAGPGVEISYMPNAWENPNAYSELNQKKMKVSAHKVVLDTVHGQTRKVFAPTEAQTEAVSALAWGLCNAFSLPGKFPRNEDGSFAKGVIDCSNYRGLLNHFNITRDKIDTAGLDLQKVENNIARKESNYPY